MEHTLELSEHSLHGVWSRDLSPVLTVSSGDIVRLSTLDAWWSSVPFSYPFAPRKSLDHPHSETGHALTGPIAVSGAEPGDAVEIEFLELTPAAHGFTTGGGYRSPYYAPFKANTGKPTMLLWSIDRLAGVARTTIAGRDVSIPLAPFPGVVGLAPSAAGEHSTTPPRRTGGNLDCRHMTVGSSLFLPVEVPGGLLSLGDGHAAQGDGEVSNNGIECPFEVVRIRVMLHRQRPLTTPLVRTPTAWMTLGLGKTLDDAARDATNAMLDLMQQELACTRPEALGLASACVHLHVTQIVNQTKGVHAIWNSRGLP